jgi:uncharacterized repeat protein (TIGR01451 family)
MKNKFLIKVIFIAFILFGVFASLNSSNVSAQYETGSYWNNNDYCPECNISSNNYGYVQCSDGSWVTNIYSCPTTQTNNNYGYVQCSDGSWVTNIYACPSSQTNNNYGYVQCSDGSWVTNINACPTAPIYTNANYRCPDGSIVSYQWQCPVIYNQPNYNYPIYQQPQIYTQPIIQQPIIQQPQTQMCWNGNIIPIYQSCPPQYQTCPNGQVILMTQVCPVNTQTCWDGSIIPVSQACPVRTQVCPNGQVIPVTQTCPAQYQTCWNGAVIPVTQTCPAQYQTCWNGAVIPITQTCPVKTTTTVVVTQVEVRNHSTVTDLATKVGATSAECNGVGLIAGNISSIGWFEYGSTMDVNNTTNSASIGASSHASFSNLITGLKPNTTYYCRAVIANKDGTYRGKIVSFKTLGETKKKVVYAAPKATAKVKPKTKTEFVCSDGSIAVARTVEVADTINSGGKLIAVNIERNSPNLNQGSIVNYRITITNNSETALTGVEAKIVLPSELSFVDATTTGGVTIKDNIMTVPISEMKGKEVKTFILPAKVANNAELGKAVVTTVYISYNLPVTGSEIVKDEVSAYMVANIAGENDIAGEDSNKKSLAEKLFPQTLLGWLVLFAIILIIVVLVMNIRRWLAERKKEKEEHTIHHHIA